MSICQINGNIYIEKQYTKLNRIKNIRNNPNLKKK